MNASARPKSQDVPLLSTKLYVPHVGPELVPRPRLVQQLDEGMYSKLLLISAPAGFGKTTLLSEWIDHRAGLAPRVQVAWYSLDEGDNDPARFMAYLVAALQTAGVDIAKGILGAWRSPQSPATEALLTHLINQIGAVADHLVLILDDYHLITTQRIHDSLAFLLTHMPSNMHLVIASRADPPLQMARLRARGELIELRQSHLRFTAEEAANFLNQVMALELSAEEMAALEARTEGWIAGLQMASLALRTMAARHEPMPHRATLRDAGMDTFIKAFTGSHRFILDYLVEEVLEHQPPTTQDFLLKTSILKRMTAPLCDAVVRQREPDGLEGTLPYDAQATLETLEQANLFIVPLDDERHWYRYHRLFSDLLRKRLRQTYPDLLPSLHRRASDWYLQNGLVAAAIEHTLLEGDLERAADLIQLAAEDSLMRSEVATLLRWVDQLPDEQVRSRPSLCAYHAWALLLSGRPFETVEARLEDIACRQNEVTETSRLPAQSASLRAYVSLLQGNVPRAADLSGQALDQLPEDAVFLRSISLWTLGIASMKDGDLESGLHALEEVARISRESGNVMVAVMVMCNLAEGRTKQGLLYQARDIYQQALETATDEQGQRLPIAGEALIGLGELARRWNKLDEATHLLQEGIELIGLWGKVGRIEGYISLSRIMQSQGDLDGARQALEKARELAIQFDATQLDDLVVAWQQVSFWIAEGNLKAARQWLEKQDVGREINLAKLSEADAFIKAHMRKYEEVVLARYLISAGDTRRALEVLEPLVARMEHRGRYDLALEGLVLEAMAHQAEGDIEAALRTLERAIHIAERGGYIQIFVDEGEPMAGLLRLAATRGIAPQYVSKLLTAFSITHPETTREAATRPHPQPLIDPLSERELEVLQLLATGISNPEMAEHLYVAVSTVRSHLKSIYSKLNVHSRWDAVHRAEELGLL
jgi:LuxR family maltose regulon positive regulatory protein